MSNFKSLQSRHEDLINRAQAGQDVLGEVQAFIEDIKSSSSQIASSSERDQLRSNLRYWASHVYEKTGTYPNVELAPSTVLQQPNRIIPLGIPVVSILIISIVGYVSFILPNRRASQATATERALANTQTAQAVAVLRTNTPDISVSATPFQTSTPTTLGTESVQANTIAIQITSLHDGDQVSPTTMLKGTYSNLQAGSSIHVIVQPISKGGIRFPMQQYALVSANTTSGEWSIEGTFGQGEDLKKEEEYLISLVVATDEKARQELAGLVDKGFQDFPSGVFRFPQTVNVHRAAYGTVIDGVRLIYSSFLDAEGNYEIFSANTDGSDVTRITYTSGLYEFFPSLSPDGRKLVYVAGRLNESNYLVYSIETVNSDGTLAETIVPQQEYLIYERPLWSSDGLYIAYAVGRPQSTGPTFWNIYVYDFEKKQSELITEGDTVTNRNFAWIPNSNYIVFDARTRTTGTSGFIKIDIDPPKEETLYFDTSNEEVQPAVSSDGSLLAYMQLDDNIGDIYVVDLATETVTQLTTSGFMDSYPAWDLDGKTIFYESSETPYITIWSVNADGSNLVQVTFGKDRYPFVGYMYALIPK